VKYGKKHTKSLKMKNDNVGPGIWQENENHGK
jgi:hypothetical protein